MLPIPMNEFVQQNCKVVGIDLEFDVVEWGTMLVAVRNDIEHTTAVLILVVVVVLAAIAGGRSAGATAAISKLLITV